MKKSTIQKGSCITTAAASMMLATANAQEQNFDEVITLSDSVVTGEKGAEETKEEMVSGADLATVEATTLEDIFQLTPNVTVNGGRAQGQQIFINGLESTLSNVTIDGAPQGNFYHHASAVAVEPDLLRQVGINSGAGSALDGLGALNGSIKFETKDAFDVLGDQSSYSKTKALYYNNGDGYKVSQTVALKLGQNWGILLSGSYTDLDDYEDGDGNVVDLTAYERQSYLLKLSGEYDDVRVNFGFESLTDDTVSFDRLNVTEEFLTSTGRPTGLLQGVQIQRNAFTADINYNPNSDLVNFTANAYYNDQSFERTESGDFTDLVTTGFDLENSMSFSDNVKLTTGVNVRNKDNDISLEGITGSEDEFAVGAFVQADVELHEKFAVSFGARYDSYDYEDPSGQSFDDSGFSPNVSIAYRPIEGLKASIGYAEAFRGVGIRESLLSSAVAAGTEAEEAENIEASIRYERNGFYAEGTYSKNTIENYLYPLTRFGSFGDLETEGYDISVGYEADNYYVNLGVSDYEPEDPTGGNVYSDDFGAVVAGRNWLLSAGRKFGDTGLTLGGSVQYRESVDEVTDGGRFPFVAGKDSYVLWSAFVRWDVPQVEGLELQLNIDNIFDKDYAEHTIYAASGLDSPGRQIRVGASYEF